MATTGLSHSDITTKFDPADLETEVDIKIEAEPDSDGLTIVDEHPASEETAPADEAVSSDRNKEAPADEAIVEPVHADARCVEAKRHVSNCSCTGNCRSSF